MLEGMYILFFAFAKLKLEDRGVKKITKIAAGLLFKGGRNNISGFMIGHQLNVASHVLS